MASNTVFFKIDPVDFALFQAPEQSFTSSDVETQIISQNQDVFVSVLNDSTMESLCNRCHVPTNDLFPETIEIIFWQCVFQCNYASIGVLSRVNTNWNKCGIAFCTGFDLKKFCPKGLTILDAQRLGITVDDEPSINGLEVLTWFEKLASHLKKKECTFLTMCKGLTLNQLVEIAAKQEVTVSVFNSVLKEIGNDPVVKTYIILTPNNIFKKSRNKTCNLQKDLVAKHGCELPTVQEYVALCVFTRRFFKDQCLYGSDPLTYGRSSTTRQGGEVLIVGGCTPTSLSINGRGYWGDRVGNESVGAGGRVKFS